MIRLWLGALAFVTACGGRGANTQEDASGPSRIRTTDAAIDSAAGAVCNVTLPETFGPCSREARCAQDQLCIDVSLVDPAIPGAHCVTAPLDGSEWSWFQCPQGYTCAAPAILPMMVRCYPR